MNKLDIDRTILTHEVSSLIHTLQRYLASTIVSDGG